MIEHSWPSSEHPSLSAILLYLEGELEDRQSATVAQHLEDCWECRTQYETLKRGIYGFMEYRREVLLPSVPAPSRRLLRRSHEFLAALPATSRYASLSGRIGRVLSASRLAVWIGAAISAAVFIALLVMPVAHPPRLTAAELIHRTRESSLLELPTFRSGVREVALQEVQVRLGDRVLERQIVLGQERAAVPTRPSDKDWTRLLAGGPIDWGNPLGVEQYQHWRETNGKGLDTVSEAGGLATLTTVPDSRTIVKRASLTVRESDWHPIAKRVEFVGHPVLEIREINFRTTELPQPTKAQPFAAPVRPSARIPAGISSIGPAVVSPSVVAPQAQVSADEAEIEVREALHRMGADVEEVPEIVRQDDEIRVRAFAQTPDRRRELLAALQDLPHVSAQVLDPETAPSAQPSTVSSGPIYSSEPPLISVLRNELGGLDNANAYLHRVRDTYRQTLVNASALQKLADRYAGANWQHLTPELRARVNQLAADYILAVRQESGNYLSQLSTGLHAISSDLIPPSNIVVDGQCQGWQTGAQPLASVLRRLEESFQRLFVVETLDSPVRLSPDDLVLQTFQLKKEFSRDFGQLCVPDSTLAVKK